MISRGRESASINKVLLDVVEKTALVLETNNLRAGGDEALVVSSLKRVLTHLFDQSVPLKSLAQLVITHDGLDESTCQDLESISGCNIDFVLIDKSTGYYSAKNSGFNATDPEKCKWVVFADADCLPDHTWLAELLSPFSVCDQLKVVAGRTSYSADLPGIALSTLDFMYFPSPLTETGTRNFYANNVVFYRDTFADYCYQDLSGVYRAHCQVLGLKLQSEGVPVYFASKAHTVHRFPDSWTEVLKLRWFRGQDTYGLTPFLVKAYLPSSMQWLGRSGPVGPLCVLISRLYCSLRSLNKQDLPRLSGMRWILAVLLIIGFSAIDMSGALLRGLGVRISRGEYGADAQALSYHKLSP